MKARTVAMAVLAGAVLALTLEGFVGRVPTMRDMAGATLPARWFWREELLSGHLALWNPFVSLGSPTVAVPVQGTFYLPQLLVALLPFPLGFSVTWSLHAFLAGVGGYALARSCGCRGESALVAGLVWATGGYVTSMWWNGEKLLVTTWIPWIAWAIREAALGVRLFGRALAAGAVAVAFLCTAGDPFLLFDAALFGAAAAFVRPQGHEAAPALRVVLATTGVLSLGLVLAAPALIPAALLSSETSRGSALSLEDAQRWSMSPVRWLDLFVPSPLGDALASARDYPGASFADSTQQVHPWAVSMFAGSATFALATAARGKRVLWPLWGVALVGVLLALGRHTPVEGWARSVVPGLARARFPEKHAVVAYGAVALLASAGLEEILARRVRPHVALVVAAGALGLVVALAPAPLHATAGHGAVHAASAVALVAGALVLERRTARAAWLVGLVLAADLVTSSRALLDWAPASELAPPPLARAMSPAPNKPPPRLLRLESADFRRVATLPHNAASLFGLGALPGWDPGVSPLVELLPTALAGKMDRLLELLRIDAVLIPSDRDSMTPAWRVMRVPSSPRAWMVGGVLAADDVAQGLKTLASDGFDPESAAVVEAPGRSAELEALAKQAPLALGPCDVRSYEPARILARCDATQAALVVMPDAAVRGWTATVDGRAAELVRADVAVRGVPIAAGHHEVELTFEPPGLLESLLVAALGALVCALAVVGAGTRDTLR